MKSINSDVVYIIHVSWMACPDGLVGEEERLGGWRERGEGDLWLGEVWAPQPVGSTWNGLRERGRGSESEREREREGERGRGSEREGEE